VQVGDLVQVNHLCDAGGLWDLYGIVIGFKNLLNVDLARVQMLSELTNGRTALIRKSALDVLNKRENTNV
tara:strand:- start:339 stop:548 length:210 start_codon:yes stop_codon:yes gene_type:complete